ncbi:hypothetical protein GQ43DRAFT_462107 [Delitschia confertaspora ATCC 74209]|uniref:BTB domain-containing protein n=1 Tax=Delitschia confertaspora ATCC 74209 TaxID=1513339 RepID=A0A9P4JNI8_9PLEO|nr:hypothetical protein GQ43DRAFT_462107 [Delitschia confertaspora ATCC 74209]
MPLSFADILQSDQFTFFVGEMKQPITVHAAAIADTSEPLNCLINGGMREAQTKTAEIVAIEPEDFMRFVEYAYRGDYTVPPCVIDQEADISSLQKDQTTPADNKANHESTTGEPHHQGSRTNWAGTGLLGQDRQQNHTPVPSTTTTSSFGFGNDSRRLFSSTFGGESPNPNVTGFSNPAPAQTIGLFGNNTTSTTIRNNTTTSGSLFQTSLFPSAPYNPSALQASQIPPTGSTSRTAELRKVFNQKDFKFNSLSSPRSVISRSFGVRGNNSPNEDFTPVFLAHARLYTFARTYLIEPLRVLALSKLHGTLKAFQMYECRVNDVITLARYVYSCEDIPDREGFTKEKGEAGGKIDPLRQLVTDFVLAEISTIGKSDEFLSILEEGGQFVGDLWISHLIGGVSSCVVS